MRVGVVGATGYAGSEVLRLCASHPDLDVVVATGDANAGKRVAEHVPALAAAYPATVFASTNHILTTGVDVVFLALPHGESQHYVPQLLELWGERGQTSAADFRLYRTAVRLSPVVRRVATTRRRRCSRAPSTDSWNATVRNSSARP